jgi:hypothetical protein
MKRLLRSWVFWGFIVLPLIFTLACFIQPIRILESCRHCGTSRTSRQWRMGSPDLSVPLQPASETIAPSLLVQELWFPEHSHAWRVRRLQTVSLFGSEADSDSFRCKLRINPFIGQFERDPEFRRFVRSKLDRKETNSIQIAAVARLSAYAAVRGDSDPAEEALARVLDDWYAGFKSEEDEKTNP